MQGRAKPAVYPAAGAVTGGERTARALVVVGCALAAAGVWLLTGPGWGLFATGLLSAAAGLFAIDIDR